MEERSKAKRNEREGRKKTGKYRRKGKEGKRKVLECVSIAKSQDVREHLNSFILLVIITCLRTVEVQCHLKMEHLSVNTTKHV